ncbi:MAG: methyl-accepting chemotaxis protein [Deltaproteobacteria bacterium]|nr:methyl-accepting chemotaxis protein [Deltaproteobacteria bacterium]
MKKMKLAGKISLGFGLLIAISLALGGMAVYSMLEVQGQSQRLNDQYVKEVEITSNLERDALVTMFHMRAYALREDQEGLKQAEASLEKVKSDLSRGQELAAKYPALAKLQANVETAQGKVAQYEKLVGDSVALNKKMADFRNEMDKSAGAYMEQCFKYLRDMNDTMSVEMDSGAGPEQLHPRHRKINLINEVIDVGNNVRVLNFKAQTFWDPALMEQALAKLDEVDPKMQELLKTTRQEGNKQQLSAIENAGMTYGQAMAGFLSTWNEARSLDKTRNAAGDEVLALARQTNEAGLMAMGGISEDSVSHLASASWVLIVGLLIALVLGVVLAVVITLSITRPIGLVIDGLSQGSQQVAAASGQVANASQALAEGAAEQAAALEETSSSLEEMASMTKQNADNANQANGLTTETNAVVKKANGAMTELTQSMDQIQKTSEETSKIIKTIDEIAFQTNLLALNAAVEAARAGEAGAGFAVVADEVRNLAMRAAEAAKNTSNLIESSVNNIKRGSELVGRTNQAFSEVAASSEKVTELVGEIAAASTEQAQGIDQVNKAATEMDKVTQQVAANAEESAASAEELSAQASTMQGFVDDLVGLVGSRGSDGFKKSRKEPKAKARKAKQAEHVPQLAYSPAPPASRAGRSSAAGKAAAPPLALKGKTKKPEEVIPLEDDDFADF